MKKLLFFAFAAISILGCSNNDDMPCATCNYQPQNSYAYCLYYNSGYGDYRCGYMSVYECNGRVYNDAYTCENQLQLQNYNSPSSSSSSEYTGGSCNASDYGAVNIGGQIWMKKNWGCYAPGSKCYGNDPANCTKYGRLYDWSTAMALQPSCNTTACTSQITTPKHKGICPTGWHIPSNADWDKLVRYVDGTSGTSSPYDSPTAGRYLKAREGWNNCGPTGSGKTYSCEDREGFSALPGGYGNSGGSFSDAGYNGGWWSSSEYSSYYAYYRYMVYYYEYAYWDYNVKSYLFSVRCLQDSP